MSLQMIIVTLLTMAIHASDTVSFSVRLAGIRVGKLAVALSLNSIVALVARTSNLLQAPLTGNMVDSAKAGGGEALLANLQTILVGATLGTLLAILLSPTIVSGGMMFLRRLDTAGSIFSAFRGFLPELRQVRFRMPNLGMLRSLGAGGVPVKLLLLNMFITGAYTVGVLSAQYASFLVPENSTMAASSVGLINGIAIILLTVFIDPKVALLSDKVNTGRTPAAEITKVFGLLMLSRLAGTLLAQVLLFPASYLITTFCSVISSLL
ncbi:lipid II flippase family protein [Paenibacillus sp. S-38]|uniref:lipid II flippase family protein n=1 Tax=Paenibacillus sp. S-38 TaxID=3416710 RepID=UPI003CF0A5A2